MKANSLLFLRITLGVLILLWGVNRVLDVHHGLALSQKFYLGVLSAPLLIRIFGALEMALGLAVVLGYLRRFAYPILLLITGATLLAAWRSVIDPWGWVLTGTKVLFYPSVIIFAAACVLYAFQDEDRKGLDARR